MLTENENIQSPGTTYTLLNLATATSHSPEQTPIGSLNIKPSTGQTFCFLVYCLTATKIYITGNFRAPESIPISLREAKLLIMPSFFLPLYPDAHPLDNHPVMVMS